MTNRSSARVASHAAVASHAVAAPIAPDPTTNVRAGVVRCTMPFDHLGERSVSIAFEAQGPAGASATVVLGGISASRHLAPTACDPSRGWWPGVVGEAAALDPARHLLVGIDYLGGNSEDGLLRPVTSHDQARALAAVLDELGIAATSIVGASYGGMLGLAFAELFPARVARLVILCAAHRTHPMATAMRSVQRSTAELGVATGQAARGLALARALAMTTYRSTREFEERFESGPITVGKPGQSPTCFPVEQYLNARGADFIRRFDTDRFLALSESIDLHATAPASLPPQTLLVSFDTDVLVPPRLVDELAARSGRCPEHITVPSIYGHDAFLKEVDAVATVIETGTPEVVR